VNSASEAGGCAPAPEQSIVPDPQSPVVQVNRPEEGSVIQYVRPHMRPDHVAGALTARDSPGFRINPVVSSGAVPALESSPGHTVYPQLLVIVNVEANAPEQLCNTTLEMGRTNREE
jgi:hypothetical protein